MNTTRNLHNFSSKEVRKKLLHATRRQPCPICEKTDWCNISEDGALVICMRIRDGAVRESKNGGFVHVLKPFERDYQAKPTIHLEKPRLAPIERRHAVYTAFLGDSVLAGKHADNLMTRGLSDTEIARNLYASYPHSTTIPCRYTTRLAAQFDLSGIPGFFRYGDSWRFVGGGPGFLIPVRDAKGRIQACQVRLDYGATRYLWFSSGKLTAQGGTSSGSPIHFARPWRTDSSSEAIITEGALKADIIAEAIDACVIAVAGVSSFTEYLGRTLKWELPRLRRVFLAFDSDWHSKPEVERALIRLFTSIERAGLTGAFLDWDGPKGLDDLLNEEGQR